MTKYQILLNILDKIIEESDNKYPRLYPTESTDIEKINQSRSRAFIHLYLKVSFGLISFDDREHYLTDGAHDGGIDGYYIHKESRTIFLIQSKFRTNEPNFENKEIELEEILVMDINRILEGNLEDENGNKYNGKIKQLQREITEIDDIGRYKYHIVFLANLDTNLSPTKIRQLTGGYPAEIVNYEKCYNKLVFPVITGTYYNAADLNISIDLSNKNAGSKISYTVSTKHGDCEITVLFVPTYEIAKILLKYKNSILKFNPRSYLEFEGKKVNTAIRETIINESTNEFALFNNGITMLSDESYINERIGQKNKAQLSVKNPQIINGGQTAYTLSRILQDEESETIFNNKEVLLKVITFLDGTEPIDLKSKLELIEQVSTATNQQTPVLNADKFANEKIYIKLQDILFKRYGVLLERKRGEFGDGISNKYINTKSIIERNLFFRLFYAAKGEINTANQKRLFQKHKLGDDLSKNLDDLDNFYFAFLVFKKIEPTIKSKNKRDKSGYGRIYLMTKIFKPDNVSDYEIIINNNISKFEKAWKKFVEEFSMNSQRYIRTYVDKETQEIRKSFSKNKWFNSHTFEKDLDSFKINYSRQMV